MEYHMAYTHARYTEAAPLACWQGENGVQSFDLDGVGSIPAIPPTQSNAVYLLYWWVQWTRMMMMVDTLYIHGYSWIFLAFWNQISRPARAAGLIQCAHVCGWSRLKGSLFHAPPWQLCQGKRRPTKGSTRMQPTVTFPLCPWGRQRRRRRRRCRERLSVFLVLSRATTWILVKDGAEGAFRAGDQCVEQLRCLPALKIKKKQFLVSKVVDHVLVMNLKDWVECSLQLNVILNFPFHLIRK